MPATLLNNNNDRAYWAELKLARQQLKIACEALGDIRNTQGGVCDRFETCGHKACQSSYTSWAISDHALNKIKELDPPGE